MSEGLAGMPRHSEVDDLLVHVVGGRQSRPNLPSSGCPFCVGGREAPEPYDVRSFVNRWPAMPGERCEVVLYSSGHDETLPSLGVDGVRKVVDLWAERTAALGARPDVDYVLVFENRGAEVGATIAHPHGQIYAYDHVPKRQRRRLEHPWQPDTDPGERLIVAHSGWTAVVPYAAPFPIAVEVAPMSRVPDLVAMGDADRTVLAEMLVDVVGRLDRIFDRPLPYMMWLNQASATLDGGVGDAWFNVEFVSPWRSAGVPRFIAAAEVASEEYFNPVVPEALAAQLRAV